MYYLALHAVLNDIIMYIHVVLYRTHVCNNKYYNYILHFYRKDTPTTPSKCKRTSEDDDDN